MGGNVPPPAPSLSLTSVNGTLASSFDDNARADQANSAGIAASTYDNTNGTTYCRFNGAWFWEFTKWTLKN